MKIILSTITLCIALFISSITAAQVSWERAKKDKKVTLQVAVQDQYPFAFYENGKLVGIEIELLEKFAEWASKSHGVEIAYDFKADKEFFKIMDAVKAKESVLGAASVTITKAREKELDFSAPYMRNKSVLVSPLEFATLDSYSEFEKVFSNGTAVVIRETTHEQELMAIKADHFQDMKVKYVWSVDETLEVLKSDAKYYTMTDLLTYWSWLRDGESGLKIHRIATVNKEQFGFVFAKDSDWKPVMDEFIAGGFGFSASEDYFKILSKYLSEEVLEEVKEK